MSNKNKPEQIPAVIAQTTTTQPGEGVQIKTPETENIPPVITEVKEPAPAPIVEPVVTSAPVKDEPVQIQIAESSLLKLARQELAAYSASMGRGHPHTAETAAKWQKRLYDVYMLAFKLSPPEFKTLMGTLIETFALNETGAFTEAYLFRGAAYLPLAPGKARLFNHITNLLLTSAEAGPAVAGREHDLRGISKELPDEQSRQYLLQFFR